LDDDHEQQDLMGNVELVVMPVTPSTVYQPQRTSQAAEARLLDEATDQATQLIDDELLDLLAGLDV
jgi:hypothetical protein